jgi:hypothetical protein
LGEIVPELIASSGRKTLVTFEKGLERDLWEVIDRRPVEKNLG